MSVNPLTYPKALEPFNRALFRSPTSEYRGAPLWSWNTKLKREKLLRQIDQLEEMGMGGFHMHVRVGLDTEYMGEEFVELMQACVAHAKEKGMLACLYDEDRWPSGAAGGLVTKDHPEFESQHILLTRVPYGEGESNEPPAFMGFAARSERGILLARYDIELDFSGGLVSAKMLEPDAPAKNVYYAYMEPNLPSDWFNGSTYVDTLNPAAISRFISITHEKFKSHLGADFGGTIPSIFTDEPQFAHKTQLPTATSPNDTFLPWTASLPTTFKATYGYDLLPRLPEIVWNLPSSAPSLARYHFHDHVCERFVTAFMDQLAAWCRGNAIHLTGHMMEEPFLTTQTSSLGEAMRCYRSLDLPGIDLLCDQYEYNTVKQATSVARQNGARGAMCEIYGVTNWTFTFEGHKGCGDWQAALGITFRVHHLSWVSMRGEGKRDFPSAIGYQVPWYREYKAVEDYFSRVNVAMTRGRPVTRVAVIHPIESFWLCFGPRDGGSGEMEWREQAFRDLTHWLLHGLVDFDFVGESLLPEQSKVEEILGQKLRVGKCEYDAVIVPNLRTIRATTLSRLRKFVEAGGAVLVAGEAPTLVDAVKPADPLVVKWSIPVPWTQYHILSAMEPFRDIHIKTSAGKDVDSLLYQMREDGDERFVFICNTDRLKSRTVEVALKGQWQVHVMDAFSGSDSELKAEKRCGWTIFTYVFEGTASLLLHLTPGTPTPQALPQLPLSTTFEKTVCELSLDSVELSEPNVLLLDYAEYKLEDETEWHALEEVLRIDNIIREKLHLPLKLDAFRQPWSIPAEDRKPKANLTLRFTITTETEISSSMLALEDATETRITLNAQPIPSSSPTGWWVDEDIQTVSLPPLQPGTHTLELTYPFGLMTNIERVYLLGTFAVSLRGRHAILTPLSLPSLAFGDYTRQGLPFYAGNTTYNCNFTLPASASTDPIETALSIPQFVAPVLKISLDGQALGLIITEPRMLAFPPLAPGSTHKVAIIAFGNRENAFGMLHLPEGVTTWYGPNEFRTDRPGWWQTEWNVKRMGVLTAPVVKGKGRQVVKVQPHILRFPYERAVQRA